MSDKSQKEKKRSRRRPRTDPKIPYRDEIKPDTPLRLSVAAALVFPGGSLSVSGLRREAARGRLIVENIAGKHYTTLHNVAQMRELCRVEPNPLASTSEHATAENRSGSFSTQDKRSAQAHAKRISERLKQRSKNTSLPSDTRILAAVTPRRS